MCHRQRAGVFRSERRPAGEHLVADHPERVHVTCRGRLGADRLFGRDVAGGPDDLPDFRERHRVRSSCDTEVGHLDGSVAQHQQVPGLDVAMNDTSDVRGVEGFGSLRKQRQRHVDRQRAAIVHHLRQRLPGHQLHDEIGHPCVVAWSSP